MSKITLRDDVPEELNQDMLSPEEVAALEGDGPEAESETAPETEKSDAKEETAAADSAAKEEEPQADAGQEETITAAATGEQAEPVEPGSPPPFAPKYKADPARLQSITERLTGLESEAATLGQRLEEGDIEWSEYHKEFAKLQNEQTDLKVERKSLEMVEEHNQQSAEQVWLEEQTRFFAAAENTSLWQIQLLREKMDAAVREFAVAKENAKATGAEILNMAKSKVLSEDGLAAEFQERMGFDISTLPMFQQAKSAAPKSQPKPATGPKTLGDLPMAADPVEGNPMFAELDRLIDNGDTFEYEAKLAQMSKADEHKYLRGD